MYITGTAIALASVALKPDGYCRGRCLLEEDGKVEIDPSTNQTNATKPIDIPLANFTQFLNISSSGVEDHVAQGNGDSHPSGIPPTGAFPDSPSQTSPVLTCPCNCTYVSASCCFSRIVWEEPSKQIQMEPPPANSSVVCNTDSGMWVPKPTASSTSTGGKEGFIGMGSVKWNTSAVGSVHLSRNSLPQ